MSKEDKNNKKKRKFQDAPELEIDVSAPEPPSKKALRRAKKGKTAADDQVTTSNKTEKYTHTHNDDDDEEEDRKDHGQETSPTNRRSPYGIWIGNLAFSLGKEDLRRFFTSNCSFISDTTITRIHMPKNSKSKNGQQQSQNKGFAYVDFTTDKAAKEARSLSDHLLSGRPVLIKDAKDFAGRPEKSQQEGNNDVTVHPPSRRIFIGNLGFDVTREDLEEQLGKCGSIKNAHMATFQDSGKCRGYAWVEFEELAAAEAAVKGYIMVEEEDDDDESEEEETSDDEDEEALQSNKRKQKATKRKGGKSRPKGRKKVWVNRLMGRSMRMEFAEDATTRYKRRFGKEGKKENGVEAGEDHEDTPRSRGTARGQEKKKKLTSGRYDRATVQKLSGAIVEPQGKKVRFD